MNATSYSEWYKTGFFNEVTQVHRSIGSAQRNIFSAIDQPPGCHDTPAVKSATVQLALKGTGTASLDLGAGRFAERCRRDAWVVAPAGQPCRYDLDFELDLLVLDLPSDWSGMELACAPDYGHLHENLSYHPAVGGLLRALWSETIAPQNLGPLWTDSAMLTLDGLLISLGKKADPARPLSKGGLAPWQVRRCTEFMAEYACHPVSLAQLADLVGLSHFHFARAFKQTMGVPPHRYQIMLRMERAKRLLETTQAPVTEVALEVGYESSQALARLFRREVGVSPSEYRRIHRK